MATVKLKAEGKSGFLKEFFIDHPEAGKAEINEAWQEAGNEDTISDSLTSKIRRDLGLTVKERGAAKAKGSTGTAKRSSAPKSKGGSTVTKAAGSTAARANGRLGTETLERPARPAERNSSEKDRTTLLIRLEGEIDDMLHEIRLAGGLPEFTETLRKARRILVRSHGE